MMRKKKIVTATLSGVLAAGMLLAPMQEAKAATTAEYSKNENVYVRMDSEGDVSGTYVVNAFTVEEAGEITDYGDYESIHNLTNMDVIEEDKDEYTFYAEEGKFYYQGNMVDADLPWDFELRYLLDGKEIEPEELAGADGDLEIHMTIDENIAAANPAFYQAYLLQVSFTLDNDLCDDIVAKGASIADAGADQKITFTVMPGMAAQTAGTRNEQSEDTQAAETQDGQSADTEAGETQDGQSADTQAGETQDGQSADTQAGETQDEQGEETVQEENVTELVVCASVTDFEMDDISINGAAMTDFPVSFVSDENKEMGQTMFIMSAQGITIPEEEVVETVVEEDNRNFIQKLFDKILNHKEED